MLRVVLGTAVAALALAATPAVALGAPAADPADLDAANSSEVALVKPGDVIPSTIVVRNAGTTTVDGLVVRMRMINDAKPAKTFSNCWYGSYSNAVSVVCSFDVQLAPGAVVAVAEPVARLTDDADDEGTQSIVSNWYSKVRADELGGAEGIANRDAAPAGNSAVRGTDGPLAVRPSDLPGVAGRSGPIGFSYYRIVQPSASPSPSASASASASASPSASVSASVSAGVSPSGTPVPGGAGGDENDGGLPVTGSQTTTVAGLGVALLLAGVLGYVMARRRRTRFIS